MNDAGGVASLLMETQDTTRPGRPTYQLWRPADVDNPAGPGPMMIRHTRRSCTKSEETQTCSLA